MLHTAAALDADFAKQQHKTAHMCTPIRYLGFTLRKKNTRVTVIGGAFYVLRQFPY